MKKLIFTLALIAGILSVDNTIKAQNINVSINIGKQPSWGPVGYDYVDYYYFPDIDCYYNVNSGMFHFYDHGYWTSSRYLPYAYSRYDLYGLYKVVINARDPWLYNRTHRRNYARYRGYSNQAVIRDTHDRRYNRSRRNNVVWYSSDRYTNNNYNSRPSNSYRPNDNRPSNSHSSSSRPAREANNISRPSYNNSSKQNSTRPKYNNSNRSSERSSGRSR